MDGVLPALISSFLFRKPLYTRTGYTFSRIVKEVSSKYSVRRYYAYILESLAFKQSSISSVSSNFDHSYILSCYNLSKSPEIIGNYIDVEKFDSEHCFDETKENNILFVGRLSREKNLENTIIACGRLGLTLDIIGRGVELSNLQSLAIKYQTNVNWLGTVSNNELPLILKSYKYFILPSLWEGMPKSLLEAMSSGLICIGNNTSGINEVIRDGYNGFLSNSHDSDSIMDAINRAKQCNYLDVSKAARSFILKNYSISSILLREQIIFKKMLNNVT
jgi:glycosyltransferase involved in cell wall biosynthesis